MSGSESQRVAVVGGGLVGATVALGLARQGRDVVLIDRAEPRLNRGELGVDIRNVALNPRSAEQINAVGGWPEERAVPYRHMVVWEERGTASIEFHAEELGEKQLGWLVEMSTLVGSLWQQLEGRVRIVPGDVEALDVAREISLKLDGGETVACDFLIAADGGGSKIRQSLGLEVETRPVHQMALATVVRTEKVHNHTAWQRFLVDGPLALLPSIEDDLVSIVWSASEDETNRRMALSDDDFRRELGFASEHRLGHITQVDARFSFPLIQQHVQTPVIEDRIVLIGDAARVVHPLAGLGVNLGFEDVAALLAVAVDTDNLCRDGLWRRYARERVSRARAMIRTLEILKRFYGTPAPGLGLIRNLGVRWIDRSGGLKHQIMREAMGRGRLAG